MLVKRRAGRYQQVNPLHHHHRRFGRSHEHTRGCGRLLPPDAIPQIILGGREDFANNMILGWTLIFGPIAFIITFLWYVKFQTPGMKAYSIKIVNRSHKRISFLQAVIRFGATLFAIASLFLLFIPFFNKDKKTFQDILSNTIIINDK